MAFTILEPPKRGLRFRDMDERKSTLPQIKAARDVVLPHFKLKNVVMQTELIEQLRSGVVKGFVYLVYAVPRSSEHYTPYALT